jgi:hypothetical protein
MAGSAIWLKKSHGDLGASSVTDPGKDECAHLDSLKNCMCA